MDRIWIYVRDSRGMMETQREMLREYCHQRDWDIVGESGDAAPGTDYGRAGLDRAIMGCRNGNADTILVKNVSILGKDLGEDGRIISDLAQYGASVYSLDEGLISGCFLKRNNGEGISML